MSEPLHVAVVEWGDREGGAGFVPFEHGDFDRPSPVYVDAAKSIWDTVTGQPPQGWRSEPDTTVWVLVRSDAAGLRWCFVVLGCGGPFPVAGGMQFVFFEEWVDAATAWSRGAGAVNADGLVTPDGLANAGRLSGRLEKPTLAAVLDGVLARQQTVTASGSPRDVAAAIQRALWKLPEAVARQYHWMTQMLRPSGKFAMVTGFWPEQVAGGETVNRWLRYTSDRSTRNPVRRQADIVAHLVESEQIPGEFRDAGTVVEFADRIIEGALPIAPAEVPALLRANHTDLKNERFRPAVSAWVAENVVDAIGFAANAARPVAQREALVDELLDIHLAAPPGANPIYLPPAPQPKTNWHDTLVEFLRRFYPGPHAMRDFADQNLTAEGRPLASAAARHRARDWLEALGLSLADFEIPYELIATQLETTDRVDPELAQTLNRDEDRGAKIGTLLGHLRNPLTAVQAAAVFDLVIDADTGIADRIFCHNNELQQPIDPEWAAQLYAESGSPTLLIPLWEHLNLQHEPIPEPLAVPLLYALEARHREDSPGFARLFKSLATRLEILTADVQHYAAEQARALAATEQRSRQPAPVYPAPTASDDTSEPRYAGLAPRKPTTEPAAKVPATTGETPVEGARRRWWPFSGPKQKSADSENDATVSGADAPPVRHRLRGRAVSGKVRVPALVILAIVELVIVVLAIVGFMSLVDGAA